MLNDEYVFFESINNYDSFGYADGNNEDGFRRDKVVIGHYDGQQPAALTLGNKTNGKYLPGIKNNYSLRAQDGDLIFTYPANVSDMDSIQWGTSAITENFWIFTKSMSATKPVFTREFWIFSNPARPVSWR